MDASDVVDFAVSQGVEPTFKLLEIEVLEPVVSRRDYVADLRKKIPSLGFFRDILIIRKIPLQMARRGMSAAKFTDWPEHFKYFKGKTTLGSFDSVLHCGLNNTSVKLILPKLPVEDMPYFLFWASVGEMLTFAPDERLMTPLDGALPFFTPTGFGPVSWKKANHSSLLLPHVDDDGLFFHDYTNHYNLRIQ